ncbi:MAG: NTP transferase domain-containing protein [Fidelibacterota bacterium]
MVDAIVLAGTPHSPRHLIQGKPKFFVPLPHGLMGIGVIQVLTQTPSLRDIYVVGNRSELAKTIPSGQVRKIIEEKGGIYRSALTAFQHIPGSAGADTRVLILACDTPFLSSRGLEDFISRSPDADLVMPFCNRKTFESLFPGFRWPYLIYKEGPLKFGNMILARPNRIGNRDLLGKFFSLRKLAVSGSRWEEYLTLPRVTVAALKLRGAEGVEIAAREIYVKYIATPLGIRTRMPRFLSVNRLTSVFSKVLDCQVEGYQTPCPELCFDIDKEETDLRYALDHYDAIMKKMMSP